MRNFPPGSQPMFKELCRFATEGGMLSTYDMEQYTSHLGSHRVLPTGRCPSKIPETFKLELLGCQILFSSRSPQCFLPNGLLFSLAALLVHQNSPLSFPDHPYHCGSINKINAQIYAPK